MDPGKQTTPVERYTSKNVWAAQICSDFFLKKNMKLGKMGNLGRVGGRKVNMAEIHRMKISKN